MLRDTVYWAVWFFFTVVFGVFYAVAFSVLLGIRDNYYRYAQKERLQWTGPRGQAPPPRLALWKLGVAAVLSAWLVVRFIIFD